MVSPETTARPVMPTILMFAGIYALSIAAMAALTWFAQIDVGSGTSLAMTGLSAAVAGQAFATRHGSLPTVGERWKLIFGSLVAGWVVSLAALGGLLAASGVNLQEFLVASGVGGASAQFWAIIAAVVSIVNIALLWLGYGPMAGFMHRQAEKQAAKKAAKSS